MLKLPGTVSVVATKFTPHLAIGATPVVTDPAEPLWTTEDVARYLRLTPNWVRDKTRTGKLPGFKVGKVWRYKKKSIDEWLKTRED